MSIDKNSLMDEIFGNAPIGQVKQDEIKNLPIDLIDDLYSFEHAYDKSLNMGLGITELAEQIKAVGLQQPIVVRPKGSGRYELLIGHRRKKASLLAGFTTIKAIVIECTDDEAKLISTDNLGQRPLTFPSEIAKAYKIQIEGYKNQGKRNDLLKEMQEENFGQQLPEVNARNIVGEKNNVSPRTVSNYLRLNELIPSLLDMVDNKEIPFMAGVHLSHLNKEEQSYLAELIIKSVTAKIKAKITEVTAKQLRELSKANELDNETIESIICPHKEVVKELKPKIVYKEALKGVEKSFENLPKEKAEKLAKCDKNDIEKIILDAVNTYLDFLQV